MLFIADSVIRMILSLALWAAPFVIGYFLLLVLLRARRPTSSGISTLPTMRAFSDFTGKPLMTQHEIVLYRKLREVLAGSQFDVFSQVAMGAIIKTPNGLSYGDRLRFRNKFDRKIIDFVICDSKSNVRLIIELDDRSHDGAKDARRDRITANAGFPTLRLRKAHKITLDELSSQLKYHLYPGINANIAQRLALSDFA